MGFNQRKTHPLAIQYGKNEWSVYLHAEINAIRNALKRHNLSVLSNSTLVVVRIKAGKLAYSKPCIGCQRAINEFNIKRVVWS